MLTLLIDKYEKELQILEESTKVSPKEILQVFLVRDRIQKLLNDKTDVPADILLKLFELDEHLKKQADKISQTAQLDTWRNSLEIPIHHWWWFLKSEIHRFDKLDWLCNSLTVTCLTVSMSLVVDISTRFLGGGIAVGSVFATIFPSILTLLTAGGVLTETGKIAIEKLLLKVKIKPYFWAETKLGISGILLFGLIGFKFYLPIIAEEHNKKGLESYRNHNWDNAVSHYEKAISLDSENAQAHRNLGLIYEQLQDKEKAKSEYKLAIQGNLPMAYSSLARLYLLEKKPTEAVSLLYIFWNLQPKVNGNPQKDDDILRYNLHKNFGWARFQQNRYEEAKTLLEKAISYHEKIPDDDDRKDGAADCLMAQVLEKLKEMETSKKYWDSCLDANNRLPEVDGWKVIARERTTNKGEN
ncbi:tetratricopeptide repeat protein [Anabaena cylindrica FACHB-243]|uniref:Tetratricopeptide TPR_2 repeat-containing protein n=1 Tax=Anabaena cylindrica (strain ATCC 27899 / PCC 7122) TaxID=272123 RepID=K9ZFJ9_ANACC|nr:MULTISPECIES: tetratricopeptide repeat protein [Anabaena]AFZ57519.1 Tetratricopeptide TPR_2 repeat-containing protein [Anabaena cylindrica PCC 7122]MBD2418456.1 tetratricopeptide repeat protein [Anabaena cylindrica FACHB-243]MBY5283667.1 tetratricopeptide repeat protein [Anabaena sp. CCAP 1446/1C]MBY5308443.1 tetratricopeptide repeat protein [Anabaena sp. CCAP 1446/1C]MCM2405117.1 tetratricopeptide repeat protein [Anabaena sp. CCAP 1446/1C]